MKTIPLGKTGKSISRIGLGCMGMSFAYGPTDRDQSLETLAYAHEIGVNFLDTSDYYGFGENEKLLALHLKGRRDDVVLATKCGIVNTGNPLSQGVDTSPAYIKQCCEDSLSRLETDVIDLYYLHRLDDVTPIEDSMGALADLAREGKIRSAGLSEVTSATVRRAHEVFPVTAVQNEYSLMTRGGETENVIDTCAELGAVFVPYSPISRGLLTGAYRDTSEFGDRDFRSILPRFADGALDANLKLVDAIEEIAREKDATKVQIALAWVLARAPYIAPIPGTRKKDRLKENAGAAEIDLSADDIARIEAAVPVEAIQGDRYHGDQTDADRLK